VEADQTGDEEQSAELRARRPTARNRRTQQGADRMSAGELSLDAPRTEDFPICPSANEKLAQAGSTSDDSRSQSALKRDAKR
jgi:hypothetical protein